jgi:uncharacterized protein YutE (UPF0331/DUF86 family)
MTTPNLDVLLNKAQIIERGRLRAREEYFKDTTSFASDFTRQDAAVLNLQRACEAALDMAQHLIASQSLGVAQSAKDSFAMLEQARIIDKPLSNSLQSMVGFRNIAVHDYRELNLEIVIHIITHNIDDVLTFSSTVLKHFSPSN